MVIGHRIRESREHDQVGVGCHGGPIETKLRGNAESLRHMGLLGQGIRIIGNVRRPIYETQRKARNGRVVAANR